MAQAHSPPGLDGSLADLFLVPALLVVLGLAVLAAAVARPDRGVALAAAAATFLVVNGAVILASYAIIGATFPKLTISNQSERVLVVSWLEGEAPPTGRRTLVVRPGESLPILVLLTGPGLRIVAADEDGISVFDKMYTWEELRARQNTVTIPD